MHDGRRQCGVTLIELIIGIVLIGLAITILGQTLPFAGEQAVMTDQGRLTRQARNCGETLIALNEDSQLDFSDAEGNPPATWAADGAREESTTALDEQCNTSDIIAEAQISSCPTEACIRVKASDSDRTVIALRL